MNRYTLACGILAPILATLVPLSVHAQNHEATPEDGPAVVEVMPTIASPTQGPELLHDNGPLANSFGTGVGGADESVLQNVTLGMSTLGFDNSVGSGWRIADDFVSDPQCIDWHLNGILLYAYQIGADPGASTITAVRACIWLGEPGNGGTVYWGDCDANLLSSSESAGVYRVTETTSGSDGDHAIMANRILVDEATHYWPGTYWIDFQIDGSLPEGPYTPPLASSGNCQTGNALQSFDGGLTWEPAIDAATGCQQDVPFQVYGVCVIPVELTSFSATVDGDAVGLAWATASETNNAGFEVQMKASGTFHTLAFVEGHGTTTEAQSYSYAVNDLAPGTYTFRLRQVDFDGAFEYSGEVEATVGTPGTHVLSEAYPNPFNPQAQFTVSVAAEQAVTVAVYNVLGQRVAELFSGRMEANQTEVLTIDGAGLASGQYVVRVVGERFSDALTVTLLK